VQDFDKSLPRTYFDRVYAENADPWGFATSEYEAAKYRQTMATLDRSCYPASFEIGCSIGVLTALLATRCKQLLAVDVSDVALEQARRRCASLANIQFARMSLPAEYPEGLYDLTILSEVGYYLNLRDLATLAGLIRNHAAPRGQLLLVHWTPVVEDYPLTGDQVHEYFLSLPQWICKAQFKAPHYRIELLERKANDCGSLVPQVR